MWTKYSSELFTDLKYEDKSLYAIHSSEISPDKNYEKRYLLMEKINANKGKILNFGDFYPGHISNLIKYYKFNDQHIDEYAETITLLIKSFNKWLDLTNNEIIIDTNKNFRMK